MTTFSALIAERDWLAVGPERWGQWEEPDEDEPRTAAQAIFAESDAWAQSTAVIRAFRRANGILNVNAWNASLMPGRAGWERVIEAFDRAIEAEKARINE